MTTHEEAEAPASDTSAAGDADDSGDTDDTPPDPDDADDADDADTPSDSDDAGDASDTGDEDDSSDTDDTPPDSDDADDADDSSDASDTVGADDSDHADDTDTPSDSDDADDADDADDTDTPSDSDDAVDSDEPQPDDAAAPTEVAAVSLASPPSPTPEELAEEIVRLRAETATLRGQLDESMKPTEPSKKRRHRSGRWWGATVCLVLGAMLLPMAVIGRWTSSTLLDTDTYVATIAPLADDADIQEAAAFRVSEVIVEVIDIEALVRDDLPRGTRFLAGPIEGAARTLIGDAAKAFVSTDAFASLWAEANRIGHQGVVAVLTGDSTDNVDASGGRVVLRVGPLVQGVLENLDEILDLNLADSIPSERIDGEFVIVDSPDLANLQGTIKLLDQLSVIIPILTLALFAASVYLSQRRRIGLRNVGYAIAIPMAFCVLMYTWVRGQYTGGLPDDIHNPNAAAAVFDITTRFLTRDLWVVLAIGVIILFVTWLIGPTGWAGRLRAWWRELISTAGDESTDSEVGQIPKWVATNERGLLGATFVLGVATLLLWTLPTATVVLLISATVAFAMIGIHILAEIGRKADADAESEAVEVSP
jgi:hypothetical protein